MTVKETLALLETLGSEKVRAQNRKRGAGDNQFGVLLGSIRKIAAKLKTNSALAQELWRTENLDARLLAILLITPKDLTRDALDQMVRSGENSQVADWLNAYIVKEHPEREVLRQQWMSTTDPWAARAGWNLTSIRVARSPDGIDISALLDRIEREMGLLRRQRNGQ
jgi:3-methyladenine DNA glycosylase AlkD